MQISAGWAKGLKLAAPTGDATRPTAAKVRAAVFNMLQHELEGALCLDLFAGSGGLGIEAVSRGARGCVFVEHSALAARCLARNVDELRRRAAAQALVASPLDVLVRDAALVFGKLATYGSFDLVFVDPPYRVAAAWSSEHAAALYDCLKEQGLLLIETDAQDEGGLGGVDAAGFMLVKRKTYGDTMVSVWEKPSKLVGDEA